MTATIYTNARVFTAGPEPWASQVMIAGDRIAAVGDDLRALAGPGTEAVDLGGAFVMPGVTDAHFHTLMTGDALTRVDLVRATDLADIQRRVADQAERGSEEWILGKGWLHSAVPQGRPTRAMLDAVAADRPILLDANDFHSAWLNSAALRELAITRDTPDPEGGEIVRDADGEPTGELKETAVLPVWDHLARIRTDADRDRHLGAALHALAAAGVTSVIDMALEATALEALVRAADAGGLTARMRAHWHLREDADPLAQIEEAARLAHEHDSPWLSVVGVKIVSDGVIDACTAAMLWPYANGAMPSAIWPADTLTAAVTAADAAGLQVAIHAIGDAAVRSALDAFEAAARVNATSGRRHRIEHIEVPDPADIPRFEALGVTPSMQPVHADPAIRDNWAAMLGDERARRGFPWVELDASSRLALGTDAPTAPLEALPNLFIAATRRSALDPRLPAPPGERPLELDTAIRRMTADAAWSCFDEPHRGSLEPGKLADLIVLDTDPFDDGPEALREANVLRTIVGGRTVHEFG